MTKRRPGPFARLFIWTLAIGLPLIMAVAAADARVGGGSSSGSRGSRTFSAPSATRTAPSPARPMERTITQPSNQGSSSAFPGATRTNSPNTGGGFFSRPGLLGGFAAGLFTAGLLGMFTGHGFFGGLGGTSSFLGMIIQLVIIFFVARLIWSWWQRRQMGAAAGASAGGGTFSGMMPQASPREAQAPLGGSGGSDLEIGEADYNAFERLLGDIQQAWSEEDLNALRRHATPEMVSYFADDLAANASRGVVNKVSNVRLLQGDLSEAWREDGSDYATVAMRFALTDKTIDRTSGRVVDGGDQVEEVTEIWTFRRAPGGQWLLSAIQQT